MIAQVAGKVVGKTPRSVVVSASGVGYEIFCTKDLLSKLPDGREVGLFTYLNVREDALELYGFTSSNDLAFFKLLLTVSGVGPKSALNILEVAKPDDIRRAVVAQDAGNLHAVHGLGKKTAEKLVVELKDKLESIEPGGSSMSDDQAVLEAIVNLGYSTSEARAALQATKGVSGGLEAKVKAALKSLSRS
jgi:Holliday junction DNA helicase RuvA